MFDIYWTERLSQNQMMTPEGYLLCKDVPLARSGPHIYGPYELQDDDGNFIEVGDDGVIYAERDPAEIFNQTTMSSFEGKSVTIKHPECVGQLVGPDNWRDITVGIAKNVRRGEGNDDDLLLADLLITQDKAIAAIRNNKLREVSLGYVANYEQLTPGHARQHSIIGNHIALVEEGRCGLRCTIGDKKMAITRRKTRLLKAFQTRDGADFAKALNEDNSTDELPRAADPNEQVQTNETPSNNEGGGGESGGNGTHHHITINVGHPGGPTSVAAPGAADQSDMSTGSPAEGGLTQEGVDPNNPNAPVGGPVAGPQDPVEMIMAAIKEIEARVTALESGGGAMARGAPPQQQAPQAPPQGGQPPAQGAPRPSGGEGGGFQEKGGFPPKKDDDKSATKDSSDNPGDCSMAVKNHGLASHDIFQDPGELNAQGSTGSGTWPAAQMAQERGNEGVETTGDDAEGPKGSEPAELVKNMATKDGSVETPSGSPGPELEKNMAVTGDDAEGPKGADPAELVKNMATKDGSVETPSGSPGPELVQNMGVKGTGDQMYIPNPMDAVRLREDWSNTLSRAELLMPGVRLPTYDAKMNGDQVNGTLNSFKRKVLTASFETSVGEQAIREFITTDSPNFAKMSPDAVDVLFQASSDRVRARNNIWSTGNGAANASQQAKKAPMTPAEMNAYFKEYYATRP